MHSGATVQALRKRDPSLDAEHPAEWRAGTFLSASDEEILAGCHQERRLLVTFDLRTIPDLLRLWAAEQRPHSGVIFADDNTVKPSRPGAVARAIAELAREIGDSDTTNLVRFLR